MKNDFPIVSIALCTYNGEAYLSKQLDSILAQTYRNIELIVVDDGSTDTTMEILRSYQKANSRIRVFENQSTLGYNKNFEKAIELCSGAYISISDQDDIWLGNKVERLLACIGECDMIYANSAFIDQNDNLTGGYIIDPGRNSADFMNYKNILLENFVTGHNVLFKRDVLRKILPFPENGFYDWWMGFVMLYEHKLGYCDEILTHYRTHERSVMNVIRKKVTRLDVTKTILQELKNFQTYPELNSEDKVFLLELEAAFKDKLSSYFSFQLYQLLLTNFKVLFPGYRKSNLNKLFFLYRYCRGLKLV